MLNYRPHDIIQKIKYSFSTFKYSKNAVNQRFNWDWKSVHYNRIALVNLLISLKGHNCKYLEIGCDDNELFDAVFCQHKIGVDPKRGGSHRMTSDEFFQQNNTKFDVVFIDGLHEYEQVRQDAINALNTTNDGAWIAFHDFLPRDWREQHVPRLRGSWTGDCWKLAVELSQTEGIDFKIININHGVGVIRAKPGAQIKDMRKELKYAQFDRFIEELPNLPRCEWEEAFSWVTSYNDKL